MSEQIHEVYMPFSGKQLEQRFMSEPQKNVSYFQKSAKNHRAFLAENRQLEGIPVTKSKVPRQMEKDERFWTAATLMRFFHSDARTDLLGRLLSRAFGERPPIKDVSTWKDCLSEKVDLFFEVDLPSPKAYSEYLRGHLKERQFIPYVLDAAKPPRSQDLPLEGPTQVDALLINQENGFAAIFEAKALSDISCDITFDVMRNQIARNVDVMLEEHSGSRLKSPITSREPDKTLFVLLTPRMFKNNAHSRLYGWLLNDYVNHPACLARDIPHRTDQDWEYVSRRLGWLTWEDCNEVLPGACPWLTDG